MVFVIPVGVAVKRDADVTPQYTGSYFLRKVIRNNSSKFKSLGFDNGLHDQMRDLYKRKHSEDVKELLDILQEPRLTEEALANPERIDELLPRRPANRLHKVDGTGLIIDNDDGSFHIIAKNKTDAEAISSWTISEIEKLGSITRDFNLTLSSIAEGRNFAERLIRQVDNMGMVQREPKNDFERQVIEDVAQITNAAIPNLEIRFQKPDESFEYDVLLPVANGLVIDIEVKDHEIVREEAHLSFETMKQKIISGPLDKARRISGTAMVVEKGFPKDKLNQLRELGTSRGVTLLDEIGYKGEIERYILQTLLRRAGVPRRNLSAIRLFQESRGRANLE
jgi:hypothetical protein